MPTPAKRSLSRKTLALMWSEAAATPVLLWLAIAVPVVTVLLSSFAGPFIISLLLEQMQEGTITLAAVLPLIGAYAVTQILGEVLGWRVALWAAWTFQVRAQKALFERVFAHLNRQSMSFHADRFSGSMVSATNKLTGAFETFWDTVIWVFLPIVTTVIAAVLIMVFVLWQYAVFLAAMSVVFILLVILTARTMEELNVAEAEASNTMTGFLSDVLTNIGAVKAQGAETTEQTGADQVADKWRRQSLGVMRPFLRYSAGFATVTVLINTGAVIAAVWAAQNNTISIPAVYLAVTYTMTVTQELWEVNQVMRNYNKVMGDCHDMVEILDIQPEVADTSEIPFVPNGGRIDIDHITFGHEKRYTEPLFDDFTLQVNPGERIGLVGHSGSGKTTLTKLLLRFNDVDAGAILIDGQDIRQVSQATLRTQIAYVPQEPLLFHRTLQENIGYGKPGATDQEIRNAAEKAYALDFIEALPEGFETMVGERGVKLSGGQRQRIAIARAVLKDAAILLLDEATSALDSESEVHIQAALTDAMQGRTTLVIAHRLSTIQKMDRIVVLDRGSIIEQGSHRELLAASGAYAGLWAHQSGGFIRS